MKTWAPRLLGATAWVVVVALGSLLAWFVISRAGDGLAAGPDPAVVMSADAGSAPAPTGSAGSTGPASQHGTWRGEAGVLTAGCTGADVRLVSAQPEDGYAFGVVDPGPQRLVVAFTGREDETAGTTTVTARCAGGGPTFVTGPAPSSASSGPTNPSDGGSGDGSGSGDGGGDEGGDG